MSLIAANEGLKVNDATLRELAKISNGDLRLVLGQLQMVRLRSAALSYDDVKVSVCLCVYVCSRVSVCVR